MSFRNDLIASSVCGAIAGVAFCFVVLTALALPAEAQTNPAPAYGGEFERPYGYGYGQEAQPFDANTRDANGNRLILDGRLMTGMDQSTLSTAYASGSAAAWAQSSGGAGSGYSSGSAIGNQLNVITQGNYNTVIVNAQQTNTGDQTTVLNGKINLDD